jgi:MFS family permease
VIAFALVAIAADPYETPSPRPRYRIQRLSVPQEARGAFVAAAVGAFLAFGGVGLFTALAATFLVGTLHEASHALAGFTVFAMFAGGVGIQIATLAWAVRRVLGVGIVLMLLGLALTVVAVWLPTPSLVLLLVGGVVSGAGAGAVFKGAVGTVIEISPADTRAEALAGLFLAGYLGLSVPALGAGVALQYVSARDTLLGFALLVGTGIVAAAPRLLGDPAAAAAVNSPA